MTTDRDDLQMWERGDLALFLGGSADSFTGLLLMLITKAQATPENYSRLKFAFPREVRAWETWNSMSPCPTFRQLREALQEQDAGKRAAYLDGAPTNLEIREAGMQSEGLAAADLPD